MTNVEKNYLDDGGGFDDYGDEDDADDVRGDHHHYNST